MKNPSAFLAVIISLRASLTGIVISFSNSKSVTKAEFFGGEIAVGFAFGPQAEFKNTKAAKMGNLNEFFTTAFISLPVFIRRRSK